MLAIDLKDKLLLLASAFLAAYAGFMLVQPAPHTFQSRISSLPIAQVISFSNIVKKKPVQSLSWENVSSENKLYQGDQIFTHNGSYAEIVYKNSTSLNLLPNTLLKIEENSEGFNIDLKKGFLSLKFKDSAAKKVNLQIGKKNLEISAKNATLQINSAAIDSDITVLSGKAKVRSISKTGKSKATESKLLESGDALKINATKDKIEITKSDIFPNYPKLGETLKPSSGPINLTWLNKNNQDHNFKLHIADNPSLKNPKTYNAKGSSHTLKYMPPGTYYWQLKTKVGGKELLGPVSFFTIPKAAVPVLKEPTNGSELLISAESDFTDVNFSWDGSHPKGFILSIAPENTAPREIEVKSSKLNLKLKKSATYTWKVRVNEEPADWSGQKSFIVKRDHFIKALFPIEENVFNVLSLKESILFKWTGPKKKTYNFQVFKDSEMKVEVLNKEIVGNSIPLKMKAFGKYFWKVSSKKFPEIGTELIPFTLIASIATLNLPKDGHKYVMLTEEQRIPFSWKNLGLKRYPSMLQISMTKDFDEILSEKEIKKNKLTLPLDAQGTYYWRIVPKNKEVKNISSSAIHSFTISLPGLPKPPRIAEKQILEFLKGYNIEQYAIAWPKVKYAKKYVIEIYEKADLKTRITRAKVKSTKILWRGERSGVFFYRVKVIDSWGRESGWSKTGKLIAPISPFD